MATPSCKKFTFLDEPKNIDLINNSSTATIGSGLNVKKTKKSRKTKTKKSKKTLTNRVKGV